MQHLKIPIAAIMTAIALGSLTSATASAAENTEILFGAGITQEEFKGENGTATLSTLAGTTLTCKNVTSDGILKPREGTLHVDLDCTGPLGVTCTGLGEAAGVVLALLASLQVYDSLTTLGVAFLLTISAGIHFTCLSLLFEILKGGKLLCLVSPINTAAKHFVYQCELSNNDPSERTYWESNVQHTISVAEGLLLQENHSTEEDMAWEAEGLMLTSNNITIDG
jgi:hypothetical protein